MKETQCIIASRAYVKTLPRMGKDWRKDFAKDDRDVPPNSTITPLPEDLDMASMSVQCSTDFNGQVSESVRHLVQLQSENNLASDFRAATGTPSDSKIQMKHHDVTGRFSYANIIEFLVKMRNFVCKINVEFHNIFYSEPGVYVHELANTMFYDMILAFFHKSYAIHDHIEQYLIDPATRLSSEKTYTRDGRKLLLCIYRTCCTHSQRIYGVWL